MRRTVLEAVCALLASAILALGCSSPAPPPNSFSEVYAKVIAPTCSNDYCHFNGVSIRYSALDMSSRVIAYWNLVDQPLTGPSCALMGRRVVPFQPDASFMYQKVSKTMPPCGAQMPAETVELLTKGSAVFSGNALTSDQLQLIFNWIAEGAQNN
jgi:predicted CxxxxCH...CXXCH cytochrome family protein